VSAEHFDVLIVGAGLSGIGAAHHLQDKHPHKSYAILESRGAIGGTWDLFRYPGIRSDSDMHTLGYVFKPWVADKAIADGPAILEYVRSTARDDGSDQHIRFNHKVTRAEWSTDDARWTVTAERTDTGETVTFTAGFLLGCTGYYSYDDPYSPEFPGAERFKGTMIHPQLWPEDLDYSGKRVVVIGSGATSVTLVPAMTDKAAHVTMLQRTPTYMASLPAKDPVANFLRKVLPDKAAYSITRWKNVAIQVGFFQLSKRRPKLVKRALRTMTRHQLPDHVPVDPHFNPPYDPWDQRFCVLPDRDLFHALRERKASIVTDHIETFTESGIQLASGEHLDADIIITATGLTLQMMGGMEVRVDGEGIEVGKTLAYKSMMLENVPNLAFAIGYSNASFTLKVDLTCDYVCKLLAHMDAHGYDIAVPVNDDATVERKPILDLKSGYVERGRHLLPMQGDRMPWRVYDNYALDRIAMARDKIDDGVMRFSRARSREPVAA
jgi:monooxygenase